MRPLFIATTLLAAAGTCSASTAQDNPSVQRLDGSRIFSSEIDQTVTRLMKAAEVTGVGLAVLNHGKVVYLKTYGLRDKEKAAPLTPDSIMSAASFTKVAFAYAVLQLVGDGALDLDKPIYEYLPKPLPEYANYADLAGDPRYKKITARMLLSHTSGFANWRSFEDDRKLNIHFEPGSRYAYSGEGIDLLQLVVETITKRPLGELIQQRLFTPLKMTRTSMVWQDRKGASGLKPPVRCSPPSRTSRASSKRFSPENSCATMSANKC